MLDRRMWSALALLGTVALCGCVDDGGDAGGGVVDPGGTGSGEQVATDEALPSEEAPVETRELTVRRGIGSITARVPGTTDVISGVTLRSHAARVTIHDGFARTEIEEEVFNDTDRTLEGRYVFPVPPGATVTRLGLWVGANLVEGEIVERRRASQIFRGIVEDVVRPRDPALLEWVRGGELSLKIFPIPARGARKVVLAYDEALPTRAGKTRYTLPLSLGADRATPIHEFAIEVRALGRDGAPAAVETPGWPTTRAGTFGSTTFSALDFAPVRDFVVEVDGAAPPGRVAISEPDASPERDRRFFTTTVAAPIPASARKLDRAIVLDTSDGQSTETIRAQAQAARAIVRSLGDDERWAVLACATRCRTFPATGLAGTPDARALLDEFLDGLAPREASDLAGAIGRAAMRLERGGQVVALHDGIVSAGELAPSAIADRVLPVLSVQGAELRMVGVGRSVDAVTLEGVARLAGASYEPLAGDATLDVRVRRLADDLARPVLVNAHVELPEGYGDVVPSSWASLAPGQAVRVYGTVTGTPRSGVARLVGELDGETVEIPVPLSVDEGATQNPLVPKLWADRAIAELEGEGSDEAKARVVALSKAFHVLSRQTSLLVLENERMFRDFGVKRTTRSAADQADHGFGGLDVEAASPDAPLAEWGTAGTTLAPRDGLTDGGQGFGSGFGRLSGTHKTSAPQVRMGATMVSGRLPPEAVQRIVRQQFGRFRACYENGLRSNPQLAGRVVARFVIGRDGLVTATSDGGSDLPDKSVVACVVRHFAALQFPQPEGGIVTVTYPIVFAGDGTAPAHPVAEWPMPERVPSPPRTRNQWEIDQEAAWRERARRAALEPRFKMIVEHQPGVDAWMKGRERDLAELQSAVAASPDSRQKRARLVRSLLANGRWSIAHAEAARFAELDPDLGLARELLAQAAAADGDRDAALDAVEALAEAEPRSRDAHLRAARALEGGGSPERACAHRRALAELEPSPAARALASACWDLAIGDGTTKPVDVARAALPKDSPASFTATVTCDDAAVSCPEIAVVTPSGRVVSRGAPWQAAPIDGGIALLVGGSGVYRTVLLGGDPRARGKVTVRAHGSAREVRFGESDPRTALLTSVEQQWLPRVTW